MEDRTYVVQKRHVNFLLTPTVHVHVHVYDYMHTCTCTCKHQYLYTSLPVFHMYTIYAYNQYDHLSFIPCSIMSRGRSVSIMTPFREMLLSLLSGSLHFLKHLPNSFCLSFFTKLRGYNR